MCCVIRIFLKNNQSIKENEIIFRKIFEQINVIVILHRVILPCGSYSDKTSLLNIIDEIIRKLDSVN